MSRIFLAAAAAVLISAGAAKADISADLKFCAGLTSGKERLACYDAAARIEKHGSPKVAAHSPISPASNAMAYIPLKAPDKSRFDGSYVGLTAGYEFAMTAGNGNQATPDPGFPGMALDSLRGPKLGVLAGYNVTSDRFLAGIEARGQYLNSRNSASVLTESGNTSLPHLLQSCLGCDPAFTPNWLGPINLNSSWLQKLEIDRRWQADISVRGGVIIQDWLVFAKAGLGAEETRTISTSDLSGSKACVNPTIAVERNGQVARWSATGCGSIQSGPKTTSTSWQLTPIAIFGLGVERNFGDFFARAEAELTAHLVSGGAFYTPSVNVTAGYRF